MHRHMNLHRLVKGYRVPRDMAQQREAGRLLPLAKSVGCGGGERGRHVAGLSRRRAGRLFDLRDFGAAARAQLLHSSRLCLAHTSEGAATRRGRRWEQRTHATLCEEQAGADAAKAEDDLSLSYDPSNPLFYTHYGRTHTYKAVISYDGKNYHGWQLQRGCPQTTIQGEIERVLSQITSTPRRVLGVVAAGRTDTGVHARAQVIHFYARRDLGCPARLLRGMNGCLSKDIAVLEVAQVSRDFHARFSAARKTYHYELHVDPTRDPFAREYSLHVYHPMDLQAMRRAARRMEGTHNFSAFANNTPGGEKRNPVRTIYRVDVVEQAGTGAVTVQVEGSGFLYKQVRNMVGALLQVALGKREEGWISDLLATREHQQVGHREVGPSGAAAHGLYLHSIEYPPHDDPALLMHETDTCGLPIYVHQPQEE